MSYIFKIVQIAKKSGGDKYECKIDDVDFVIYFPQTCSRINGKPKESIILTIVSDGLFKFKLIQKAKKSGGDKYECINDDKFNIYFPQSLSRPNGDVLNELSFNLS